MYPEGHLLQEAFPDSQTGDVQPVCHHPSSESDVLVCDDPPRLAQACYQQAVTSPETIRKGLLSLTHST